ncbi:MAG TPA: hypothetical protein VJ577_13675 [Burkholderiaceae bacterium]|nr:hypothetical protein [Burkholderiaceae bacterium]
MIESGCTHARSKHSGTGNAQGDATAGAHAANSSFFGEASMTCHCIDIHVGMSVWHGSHELAWVALSDKNRAEMKNADNSLANR